MLLDSWNTPTTEDSYDCCLVIDSSHYSNEIVFTNDKRDPIFGDRQVNAEFAEVLINGIPWIFLRATKDILKKDEIIVEYCGNFWQEYKAQKPTIDLYKSYADARYKRVEMLREFNEKQNQSFNDGRRNKRRIKGGSSTSTTTLGSPSMLSFFVFVF